MDMSVYFVAIAFSVLFNLILYVFAYLLQTDKITDLSYSLTFVVIAISGFMKFGDSQLDFIILCLVLMWAFRLGAYLFYRILKIGHDDRFDDIRSNPISFLKFWIMQGITCALVSFPVIAVYQSPTIDMNAGFAIGALLSFAGFFIETMADFQKFNFKLQNPKKFMNEGIWKKIRHPNYTGELMFWWGTFICALSTGAGWLPILGPIWISLIILKFSGIPPLETKWEKNYGNQESFKNYWQNSYRLVPFVY